MIALDTNIILLDANNIFTFPKDQPILLAETVIDELDSKKSELTEIGFQARSFGRLISFATLIRNISNEHYSASVFDINGVEVHIVSLRNYPDFKDSSSSIINDRKIIQVASYFGATFISNDVMARIRATAEGLKTSEFKVIDSQEMQLTKHITLDDAHFDLLDVPLINIKELDPEHTTENYNYIFTCSTTGQSKLCTVLNEQIFVLDKELEEDFRKQDIPPINSQQMFFTWHLQNPAVPFVICESPAGTGKSALAISNGIRLVRKHQYEGILYIRSSVNDVDPVEEVGFLPGLEEKFSVYLHPLEDTLDFIARNKYKNSKFKGIQLEEKVTEYIKELREKVNIQGITTLGMRGRTFSNLYIIIDEFQNMSPQQAQKVLTRIGKNCKVVVLGSQAQIDNKYITKHTNGLGILLNAACKPNHSISMVAVDLTRIVRSPMAEFAEHLFSK